MSKINLFLKQKNIQDVSEEYIEKIVNRTVDGAFADAMKNNVDFRGIKEPGKVKEAIKKGLKELIHAKKAVRLAAAAEAPGPEPPQPPPPASGGRRGPAAARRGPEAASPASAPAPTLLVSPPPPPLVVVTDSVASPSAASSESRNYRAEFERINRFYQEMLKIIEEMGLERTPANINIFMGEFYSQLISGVSIEQAWNNAMKEEIPKDYQSYFSSSGTIFLLKAKTEIIMRALGGLAAPSVCVPPPTPARIGEPPPPPAPVSSSTTASPPVPRGGGGGGRGKPVLLSKDARRAGGAGSGGR